MANSFTAGLDGMDALKARLSGLNEKLKRAVSRELYQFGEEIMAASKEVVPVDTGTLMNTGHVDLPVVSGEVVTVTLGYGGPAAAYARLVHENLSTSVHWQRPGSGPKYLENPFNERKPELSGRIADVVRTVTNE